METESSARTRSSGNQQPSNLGTLLNIAKVRFYKAHSMYIVRVRLYGFCREYTLRI